MRRSLAPPLVGELFHISSVLSHKFVELIFFPAVTGIFPVIRGVEDEGTTKGATDLDRSGT